MANAGIIDDGLFPQLTEAQFGRVLDTNLTGAFRCASRASHSMLRGGWVG